MHTGRRIVWTIVGLIFLGLAVWVEAKAGWSFDQIVQSCVMFLLVLILAARPRSKEKAERFWLGALFYWLIHGEMRRGSQQKKNSKKQTSVNTQRIMGKTYTKTEAGLLVEERD